MRIVLALSTLAFIAGGCAVSRTESSLNQAEALDSLPAVSESGVKLEGPTEETMTSYTVSHKDGKAIRVDIDKGTIKACFLGIGYSVTKLQSDSEYLVEIQPMAVPAVVCSPAMKHDIETGVTVEIPKTAGGANLARIYIHNKLSALSLPKVKVSSGAKLSASELVKFDSYSYYSNTADAFSIDVDKRKIQACGPSMIYATSVLNGGGYMVQAMPLHVQRFCPPTAVEDIEIGTTIELPRSSSGYHYGTLLVSRPDEQPLKVAVRESRKASKALQCNVYDGAGNVSREMRIALFYSEGADKATATIESRYSGTDDWTLDYSETQTTVVAEGKGVTRLLAEGRTSFPGYVQALDWDKDSRLTGRCWANLPNYDLELTNASGTPAYVGEVTTTGSVLVDPRAACDMPQFSMAPPAKPTLIKCGAEGDQID